MITKRTKLLLLSLAIVLLNSCMSFSDRSFNPVKREIRSQIPDLDLEKEFAVSIGPAMFNAFDAITVGSDFDFSSIDKVQIAVYEVDYSADLRELDVEKSLMARDPRLNWQTVVKVKKQGEFTWVVIGIDEGKNSIEAVSILVMEQNELVLINVNGELEEMIEFAFTPVQGHKGVFKST